VTHSRDLAVSAHEPAAGRLAVYAIWLLRLRWVACAGQLATVGYAAAVFGINLPMSGLLAIIGLTALSNVALSLAWRRLASAYQLRSQGSSWIRRADWLLAVVMGLDVAALTGLLFFAGGPSNPFAVFYFVNLALAAVILPARQAWLLLGMALVGWSSLFAWHVPLPELQERRPLGGWPGAPALSLQWQGWFVALAGCASVVVSFVTYVTRELGRREAELRAADQQRARGQRLEALATLAAGAAHELATPLATIAVVAEELTRHLENVPVPATVREDVALIRGELDRCRATLDRMSASAGQAVGEEAATVEVRRLVEEIMTGLRRRDRVEVSISPDAERLRLHVPLQALAQAVRGVVRNGLDAAEAAGRSERVRISLEAEPHQLRLEVRDHGPGMPSSVLARAGEPFFTTKEPGRGMGLGLFLCRSVVERLGGTLELRSTPGQGTTAIVKLPAQEHNAR